MDLNEVLCNFDAGMDIAWLKGFVEQLQYIPLDFVHILSQHIAIDIDNSLVFSKYHARNAMGEVLTEDIDISAFLQKNIFPQVND